VPVYDTFTADTLTPVSAYLRLAQNARYACLLESVEGGEKIARYTFVGANPSEVFRYVNGACVLESDSRTSWVQENPLDYLRNRVERYRPVRVPGLPPLVAGAIGYFAYDMVRLIERIPDETQDDVGMDDAVMMFFLGLVVFDHVRHRVWIVRNVFTDGEGGLRAKYNQAVREIRATRRRLDAAVSSEHPKRRKPRPFKVTSNFSRAKFLKAVEKSKEYIRAGDIFQVAISQRFAAKTDADPFEIYRSLRVVNPSPYMYFLKLNDLAVVGSSPEMLVKVQGRDAFYRPIAGTRARGANEKEDAALEAELAADPKEQAEHIMLVDLGRNDLSRVCRPGTVTVERFLEPERFSHITHLVSEVSGELRAGIGHFELLRACFPAGTVSGAPKVSAMQLISELEGYRRGPYAGAVLYALPGGPLDACIAIRTIVLHDGVAHLQAGAGIVSGSDPRAEHEECLRKLAALEAAIDLAEAGAP
jgi:anthranilate synthase component 1